MSSQTPGPLADTLTRWNNRSLFRLMWPLMVEQLLAFSIGMVDTVMVASLGESAVSGVSVVDSVNILLLMLMSALATGGAVVSSQYLGKRDRPSACSAARQLVYAIVALSIAIMVPVLIFHGPLLNLIYGTLDAAVMRNAETYLWISAISYPFIALYNAASALFRSMGNSRIGMVAAFFINILNIGGNALLIYGFGMGVAGAAFSTLFSRAVAAVILVWMLMDRHAGPITLAGLFKFHFSKTHLRQILKIGIPNGLENSMFQIGKLMVARMVTAFGTSAIAANAISLSIATFANLPGQAFGLALITVVGQCVGAKDYAAAKQNTKKVMLAAIVSMTFFCLIIFLFRRPLLQAFNLSAAAVDIGMNCLLLFCIAAPIFWPISFVLPNALRAAGDARYTMGVSMFSMWVFRIGCAWWFSAAGYGVFGIWMAMVSDWLVRSGFFVVRWLRGKWQAKKLI